MIYHDISIINLSQPSFTNIDSMFNVLRPHCHLVVTLCSTSGLRFYVSEQHHLDLHQLHIWCVALLHPVVLRNVRNLVCQKCQTARFAGDGNEHALVVWVKLLGFWLGGWTVTWRERIIRVWRANSRVCRSRALDPATHNDQRSTDPGFWCDLASTQVFPILLVQISWRRSSSNTWLTLGQMIDPGGWYLEKSLVNGWWFPKIW